jgi:HlyD family secretion protein
MTRKKVLIGLGIVVLVGAMIWANFAFKKEEGPTVTVEAIKGRKLESIVSASGKVRARRTVNITSEVSGKVVKLSVEEGDRVKQGQFLLQIDPRNVRNRLQVSQATLEQQRIALTQARQSLENAKVSLKLAHDELARQQRLDGSKLATKQALEQAQDTVTLRTGDVKTAEQAVATAEQRIRSQQADLANAEHDLSRVTIESPIDGLITRRNVEEGEQAVVGFTNNPSVVLLTVADMSVIEAEIEVDETDVPSVKLGQRTKVTIDALPDRSFTAKVTEVGNSPINASSASVGGVRQATNFKVVVTLDGEIPDVRPGFTCTADITTADRENAVSVPIQALTVRELTFDPQGKVVKEPRPEKGRPRPNPASSVVEASELKPGYTKKEVEGVFLVGKDDTVEFVQVKTGIAGDKHFEVLEGLKAGDRVITGPFSSVRTLKDGTKVKVEGAGTGTTAAKS